MKFGIKNLGPIKEANIDLGKLTIICGKNNTGKTYLTYALSTFLDTIGKNLSIPLENEIIDELMQRGSIQIDMRKYIGAYLQAIQNALPDFTETLPHFLAMHPDRFKSTETKVELTEDEIIQNLLQNQNKKINLSSELTSDCELKISRLGNSFDATISVLNKGKQFPQREIVDYGVRHSLAKFFSTSSHNPVLPEAFIITCERTGAALFRTELIMSRELFAANNSDTESRKIVFKQHEFRGYQRPVAKDLEFVVGLKSATVEKSSIPKYYDELIALFSETVGGEYILNEDTNQVKFQPAGTKEALTLAESSSTVRSLMEFNYYLKHKAKPSQIFVFDEPELNLHPENQRKLARLLAMLVNAGIKVFITTHSDYIIKEFNTLLMLNFKDDPRMEEMQKKYSYSPAELLDANEVRVYCVQDGSAAPVTVSQDSGIAISSFDDTIREMACMQRDILKGGIQNA
jgi:predicted ATPase